MAGTLISKIVNGEDNSTSFTNLQQSMLMLMRSHDGMVFGNFAKGNTSMLNVLAQSSVSVNYNVYKWTAAEDILYLASNGSSSAMSSAPAAEYYLIAVINADSNCTICAKRASEVSAIGSADYGGWYISGTQTRIIGGFTKNSDGTYTRKWQYQLTGRLANEASEYTYRVFADGVEEAMLVNTDEIDLYTSTPYVEHTTTAVYVADFTASCPSQLVFKTSAVDYGTNADVSGYSTSFDVILYARDKNGFILGEIETKSFTVGKYRQDYRCVFNIVPGLYYCLFIPHKFRTDVSSGGGSFSGTIELFVKTYNLRTYLTNIYGARKGTY